MLDTIIFSTISSFWHRAPFLNRILTKHRRILHPKVTLNLLCFFYHQSINFIWFSLLQCYMIDISTYYITDKYHWIGFTGPKSSTIEDFWQMVWQEDVYVIAMVTNLSEGGTVCLLSTYFVLLLLFFILIDKL